MSLIALLAIGAWAAIVLYRMQLAGRSREQLHRERLAMIEKGLVPPPESDPQQFERMMDWRPNGRYRDRPHHSRRVGIILIAVGLGISIQGYVTPMRNFGWGSGAFLLFLGIAFLVIAMFEAQPPRDQEPRTSTDAPKP